MDKDIKALLETLESDLTKYADAVVDSRYWGGPTIPPKIHSMNNIVEKWLDNYVQLLINRWPNS